ncbi:MAG: HypC/HybG/HupF family hydrogenase formation chaperone [bacterium]|nr:HypC/HybG/HupF family hydrogenase formation chaperone [bacterium]
MCLTIPKKVLSEENGYYVISKDKKSKQKVKSIIKIRVGDFVLTQNNVIIQKITKKQAGEINKLLS